MEHYVTLFNRSFLPQGLALHESLERHAGDYTLWVLCLDEKVRQVLTARAHPNLRTIPLHEVETPTLLAVKPGRSLAEYCWTLTPFAPKFVFDRDPSVRRITYLDADLFLLKNPKPIFVELEASGKSVLITEHAYDAEYDDSATNGKFCVQFMTFDRELGEPIRSWWEQRCLEWCFNRQEEGKFGDQKYLDDWPERFPEQVHVLQRNDYILAPWNARRFPYSSALAWHFHGLRIQGNNVRWHSHYQIPEVVDKFIYLPYISLLQNILSELGETFFQGEKNSALLNFAKEIRWAGKNMLMIAKRLILAKKSRF
jgi:hypothetical protein